MNRDQLAADLVRDEDLRLKPYRCTAGKLTIGVGRNLEDVGITKQEALFLLSNDMARVFSELDRAFPWWATLPPDWQRGLANMDFNLGISRLSGFKGMLAALKAGDGTRAAREALDSRWARQVGDRSERIAALFRS